MTQTHAWVHRLSIVATAGATALAFAGFFFYPLAVNGLFVVKRGLVPV